MLHRNLEQLENQRNNPQIMKKKSIQIISLDGNIGAGKTTILEKYSKDNSATCIVKTEPVDEWKDLLQKTAEEPKKYVYELQRVILQHFEQIQKEISIIIKNNTNKNIVVVVERSAMSSIYIFATIYLKQKILTEEQFNTLKTFIKKSILSITNAY